ncbi:MAG: hypothetical protein AAF919_04680 [Pseudomonadota bacterium]
MRTDDERMAYALTEIFNRMGAEGWEYVRTDTFTSASRADVTGTASRDHTLLVFRRMAAPAASSPRSIPRPEALPESQPVEPLLLTTPVQTDPIPSTDEAVMNSVRAAVT